MPEETIVVARPIRDVRVDELGFINDLSKLHGDSQKTRLKVRMEQDGAERCEGDFYNGILSRGTTQTIDPKKLYRLFKNEEISEADFISCIAVRKEPAERILSGKALEKISTKEASSPSLRIYRNKDVNLQLVDVLKGLNKSLALPAA